MVNKEPSLVMRLVVYPVIAGFFLLGCFLIALLAMGYNLKIENGKIVKEKTGSIIIASRPGDAVVFVDGKEHDRNTPLFTFFSITVDRLKPGEHTVRIEKTGYETWEDKVMVEPGLVSWLNYILFLPTEKNFYDYKFSTLESFIASPDETHQYALTRNASAGTVAITEINSQNKEKEKIFETRAQTNEVYKLAAVSKNNDRVLISKKVSGKTTYSVIETKLNGKSFALSAIMPDEIYFSPKDHRELVYRANNTINRYEYESNKNTVSDSGVLDLSYDFEDIFYVKNLDGNYGLWRVQNKPQNIIKSLPASEKYQIDFLEEEHAYAVLPTSQKDLLLFRPDSGNYILKRIAGNVDYFKASSKSKHISFKSGSTLSAFEVEKSKTVTTINGEDVKSFTWAEDEANIFYTADNKLKMVNFTGKYNRTIKDKVESLILISKNYNLYFINSEQKDLSVFSFNL